MAIKFSILIPVYNREKYLPQLFENIKALNYQDFEVIMVNDASTDNSLQLMQNEEKVSGKLKVITYPANKNAAGARNEGLKHCQGDFICLLDSDDLLERSALEKANDFLSKNPEIDVLVFDELKFNDHLNAVKLHVKFTQDYYLKKQTLFRTAFGGAGSVIRTSIIKKVGGYDPRMVASNDKVLSYRLFPYVKTAGIPQRLYYYREHDKNLTKTDNPFKKTAEYLQIIQTYQSDLFQLTDYINDWQQVKNFLKLDFDHRDLRRKKYANLILKCALKLAEMGERKLALQELKKAEYIHPKPRYILFKLLIYFGKKDFDKFYRNMNAVTDYYYDDFMQIDIKDGEKIAVAGI